MHYSFKPIGIVAGYGAGAFFGESNNWHGVFQSALPFEALMLAGEEALRAVDNPDLYSCLCCSA
jgi:hypothetical protein